MVPRTRLLPFAYLLALSAVVGLLAVVGAVLDRLLPGRVGRAYGARLVRLVAASTAPLDRWAPDAADPDSPVDDPDPIAGADTTD